MNQMLTETELFIQGEKAKLVEMIKSMSDEHFTHWLGGVANTVEVMDTLGEFNALVDIRDQVLVLGGLVEDQAGQLMILA